MQTTVVVNELKGEQQLFNKRTEFENKNKQKLTHISRSALVLLRNTNQAKKDRRNK